MAFATARIVLVVVLFTSYCTCTVSLRSRAIASTQRRSFVSDDSIDSTWGAEASVQDVEQRMQYWSATKPDIPATDSSQYLLFDPDIGGLNNIRIGWEAAGFAAAASGRTLVLPPARPWYLLDNDGRTTSRVEDFINLDQLKNGLPTLTFDEFIQKERDELDKKEFSGAVPSYQAKDNNPQIFSEWLKFAHGKLDLIQGNVCSVSSYQNKQQRFLYVPADGQHRIFGCSAWYEMGQPKFLDDRAQLMQIPSWGYKLLKDDFVWNSQFWDMAAPVVQELGLFSYFALHARFGDFQYKDSRQPFDGIATAVENVALEARTEVPSLFQMTAHATARARARGEMLAQRVASVVPLGETLYIATDEKSPALLEAFTRRGINAVRWEELLTRGDRGPLSAALIRVGEDTKLLKKFSGPIEQLICAYSKVFIGTSKSTFSGYIQRLRTYNGAPEHTPLYHTLALTPKQRGSLQNELAAWSRSSTPFDSDAVSGVFPPATPSDPVLLSSRTTYDYFRRPKEETAADRQAEHDMVMAMMRR